MNNTYPQDRDLSTSGQKRREFIKRSAWLTAGISAAAIPAIGAARGADKRQEIERISDAGVRELIDREREKIAAAMTADDIPGGAVGLIYRGKIAWMETFGVTDHKAHRPIDPHTIFSIQSTSKNFTATAIMMAVQRGLLDLDRSIASYLPDFSIHSRFEEKPLEKMTLRHLLSHRARFTHEAPVGNNADPVFPSFEAHVQSISQTWLRFPVGDRPRYSNLGVDLAGYILQKVMGQPFAECLDGLVLKPLQMNDTTAATDIYMRRHNRAIGHQQGFDTVPERIPLIPSGGVYTSIRDMTAYALFHTNKGAVNGKAVLEKRLWEEMHAIQRPGCFGLGVAGGVFRFGNTDVRMRTHSGGGFGFGANFRFYPEAGLAWIALFNRAASIAYQSGGALTDGLLDRDYGARVPRVTLEGLPQVQPSPQDLQKFSGNWMGRGLGIIELKIVNGALVMLEGGRSMPVRVTSQDEIAIARGSPADDAVELRYCTPALGGTAHLESLLGDFSLDYNDGPNDPAGPNPKHWDAYVGDYSTEFWGRPGGQVKIHRKNGYLYLNQIRLVTELEPGLFFTSDGEVVDFRQSQPIWSSSPLRRAAQS